MLTIQDLTKTYPNGVQALRGIDLTIQPGLFGLLGPNGAGKSSLMRTLATLQDADGGSVRFGDLDVLRDKDQMRRVLGYLPQDFGLYPRIDAETLLHHFARLKGVARRGERSDAVERLLRLTNLWPVRRQKLGTFSGGMRQRFGIAQALLGEPRLLIVDEPTTGLDPEERRRFLNLLASVGEQAVVILSTHLVADVSELCRQMAVIRQGEVVLQGDPEQLLERLRGRIWRRTGGDPGGEPPESALLLSTHLHGGRTVARYESTACPGPEFVAVEANLEDVYFSTLRGGAAEASRGHTPS